MIPRILEGKEFIPLVTRFALIVTSPPTTREPLPEYVIVSRDPIFPIFRLPSM